jgi:N-formylglutamate deformylase
VTEAAFEIIAPPEASVVAPAVVAHVPHSSVVLPAEVREELLISDPELRDEMLRLTDWYTDELFAGLTELGATRFVNRLSRLVFDPERFLDDAVEPAARVGQGVVYVRGTRGQQLRLDDAELRTRRIEELYRPYHAALDGVVAEQLAEFGQCTVLDCHSFPTEPAPTETDEAPDRPDICIGTDDVHTPEALAAGLEAAFVGAGFRVKRNSPFAGTFVPSGYYGRDGRVSSVMIEVRRDLYMDEATGERAAPFEAVSGAITAAARSALASSQGSH